MAGKVLIPGTSYLVLLEGFEYNICVELMYLFARCNLWNSGNTSVIKDD